ncbi:MAG: hypothetical protein JNN00_18835 [Chitinophagaceae bacterium]|nr:hypothetical protein [Chitinophagaceae bacterium]
MQSENFDNKLRQAAEQHHPSYDEKAWTKMEKLLDRELPQKEDRRRRFIFLFFFFLLLGGGIWLLIGKPWQQEKLISDAVGRDNNNKKPEQSTGSGAGAGNGPGRQVMSSENGGIGKQGKKEKNEDSLSDVIIKDNTIKNDQVTPKNPDNSNAKITPGQKNAGARPVVRKTKASAAKDNNFDIEVQQGGIAGKVQPAINETKNERDTEEVTTVSNDSNGHNNVPVKRNNNDNVVLPGNAGGNKADQAVADKPAKNTTDLNQLQKDSANTVPESSKDEVTQSKSPVKKKNLLSFSFSAGPDISAIGFDDPGKVKMVSGVGVGYTIKERWMIRTGFYSARKIYDAKPSDYKPSVPVLYPNYLKNIAADCKVYEIPLTLAYSFGRSAKGHPFASAGLSSIIMKEENYRYQYVYPGGTTYNYLHSESNKYKHYFSVLSLSGGYQRRVSKIFSLTIEPYVKLPLAGVGYGKVKLSSAGILFSVNVSPFRVGQGK